MFASLGKSLSQVAKDLVAFVPAAVALADCPVCQAPYLSCHQNSQPGYCQCDNDGSGEAHMVYYYDCYATCPPYDYCYTGGQVDYSQPCYVPNCH